MYFGCCIYVLLLLNMPEMAHDWINKSILFYSILFYSIPCAGIECPYQPVPKAQADNGIQYPPL